MKYYLEPSGWPSTINNAPNGLVARMRKGKMFLYYRNDGKSMQVPPFTLDMEGNVTTVTGPVTAVTLKTEK